MHMGLRGLTLCPDCGFKYVDKEIDGNTARLSCGQGHDWRVTNVDTLRTFQPGILTPTTADPPAP